MKHKNDPFGLRRMSTTALANRKRDLYETLDASATRQDAREEARNEIGAIGQEQDARLVMQGNLSARVAAGEYAHLTA